MERIILFVLLIGLYSTTALATWSISAVDRETGEIGIAGASCTFNVQGIGEVLPGKGAVIVQAMSSDTARAEGMKLLREGKPPTDILSAIKNVKFDFENQQYSVISLANGVQPAVYSGISTSDFKGAIVSEDFTVQGNILAGAQVLTEAERSLKSSQRGHLSKRLVDSLLAGSKAGGDKRCGSQTARSAFVTVYKKDDSQRWPHFHLVVYGIEKGGSNAVSVLAKKYKGLQKQISENKSTRVYIQQ